MNNTTVSPQKETSTSSSYILEVALYIITILILTYSQYITSTLNLIIQLFACAVVTIAFPAIHIAIFSIFKTKRKSKVRKRILKGWFIIIMLSSISNLYQHFKPLQTSVVHPSLEVEDGIKLTKEYLKEANKGLEQLGSTQITTEIIVNSVYLMLSKRDLRVNFYVQLDDYSKHYSEESLSKIIDKDNACSKYQAFLAFENIDTVTAFLAYRFIDHKVIDFHVECFR